MFPSDTAAALAGQGGVPGGRPAGQWIGANLVPGTELMTIGPSMANILEYYGHRPAQGLSVSTDPLHRNPAYTPIYNPDLSVRDGQFSYLVWDAYSACAPRPRRADCRSWSPATTGCPSTPSDSDGRP